MDTKYAFGTKLDNYFADNREELKNGMTLSLQVLNYQYDGNQGFSVNYIMDNRYKVKLPPVSNTPQFELSVEQKPPIEDLGVGDTQSFEITIENKATVSQGMVVVVLSTPSCMEVDMNELEILKERD